MLQVGSPLGVIASNAVKAQNPRRRTLHQSADCDWQMGYQTIQTMITYSIEHFSSNDWFK